MTVEALGVWWLAGKCEEEGWRWEVKEGEIREGENREEVWEGQIR